MFDIGRSRHRCAMSGVVFVPGDPVVAALFDDPEADGVLHRLDFSPEGWERFRGGHAIFVDGGGDDGASGVVMEPPHWARPARVFASWKAVAAEPGQRKSVLDEGSMLEVFESLEGSSDDAQLAFRFVLALVLIRRKLLVHAGAVPAKEDGGDALLLVRAKGDPVEVPAMEVVQPALTPERIAGVTAKIEQLLQAGGQ